MTLEAIREHLHRTMPRRTYEHVLRVEETGAELAALHGLEEYPVRLGCLLHDAYKHLTLKELQDAMAEELNHLTPQEREAPNLLHGQVAARLCPAEFGVSDPRALEAMRFHTTGHPAFSPEALAVFVADKSEPARDYHGIAMIRFEARRDLTAAAALITRRTLAHLLKKNQPIHPAAIDAYNHWRGAVS